MEKKKKKILNSHIIRILHTLRLCQQGLRSRARGGGCDVGLFAYGEGLLLLIVGSNAGPAKFNRNYRKQQGRESRCVRRAWFRPC